MMRVSNPNGSDLKFRSLLCLPLGYWFIAQQLIIVDNYEVLILELTNVPFLDLTATLAIENMVKETLEKRRQIFLVGATGQVKLILQRLKLLTLIPLNNQVNHRQDALSKANFLLNRSARQTHKERFNEEQ